MKKGNHQKAPGQSFKTFTCTACGEQVSRRKSQAHEAFRPVKGAAGPQFRVCKDREACKARQASKSATA